MILRRIAAAVGFQLFLLGVLFGAVWPSYTYLGSAVAGFALMAWVRYGAHAEE